VHGLDELGLADTLGPAQRAALMAPYPRLPADTVPVLSNYMAMLWHHRANLRAAFDLSTQSSRQAYAAWFCLRGPIESAVIDLLVASCESQLEGPAPLPPLEGAPPLPLVLFLAWSLDAELAASFDPASAAGRAGLLRWGLAEGQRSTR
jgi:hypothetical protein